MEVLKLADNNVIEMKKAEMEARLEEAIKSRKKLEEAQKRLKKKQDAEEKAINLAKEAIKARKEAEKIENKLKNERSTLEKLAGCKPESKSSRIHYAGQGFFDLLNKFDTDEKGNVKRNGSFSKKYNSLNIEVVAKAVLKCSKYFPDSGNICIFGDDLKKELDKEIADRENSIKLAKEFLDEKFAKMLPANPKKEETKK